MAANIFRRILSSSKPIAINKILQTRYSSIYEPDYLEAIKPRFPFYPPIVVEIRGYDYPIVESYQRWVHKIAEAMDFDVENSYAMPAKELKILRNKPKTSVTEMEYFLKIYRRDLKISNVASVRLPIFIRVLEAALPEGMKLDIEEYSMDLEKVRYVPDKSLLDYKELLSGMLKEKEKKKKKK